ncbi:glycoside hydrolase family 16 protein [Aspergillus brunneoviolaceus CBS 621.78]|uniref:chitinase n=2 Tax=Aspergillus TaxID=5052 RepID=A0A8G1W0M1_9EURO|nr:cell wall glucanase [Aspergillus brunneoviolaceus CBS 621.78]XP_040802733.1 cell wall glucanase [Aspergillus fijiensis CBS 313.89]RAH43733.1 cell wall glucanase [Aspergillus brunneoviolaceus CBS 621.78]RAK78723.1 cell wall glucanase [Aspergillus fijiensis CBS 313.89]
MSFFNLLALIVAQIYLVAAQTSTTCNPLNATCPSDPALGTTFSWQFNETLDSKIWETTNGHIAITDAGANFTIAKKLDSPTIKSTFYIFFGVVESWVKMAKGGGVISSIVLESDDLDEIDWEWVGYNTSSVQSNYFGKGNDTSFDRGGFHYVPNADTEFHNYTTYWDAAKLEWWIDGTLVRTLKYEDALDGKNYPQTPCTLRYGIWPGGDPSEPLGTIEWAGGEIDYDAGPYNMVVQKVRVQDFHTGKEYEYTNHTGSWESIKVVTGNSTAAVELNKEPEKTLAQKWAELPTGAKIGVYAGSAAVGAMLLAAFILFFVRQRKKGRLEHALDDAKWNTERTEMDSFQQNWKQTEWRSKSGYKPVS